MITEDEFDSLVQKEMEELRKSQCCGRFLLPDGYVNFLLETRAQINVLKTFMQKKGCI